MLLIENNIIQACLAMGGQWVEEIVEWWLLCLPSLELYTVCFIFPFILLAVFDLILLLILSDALLAHNMALVPGCNCL